MTDDQNDENRYIEMRNAPGDRIDLSDRSAVDRAIATANRAADFTMGRGDPQNPQGNQDAAGLELRLETKLAQRKYYTSRGLTPPDWLNNEINSASKSLNFQHQMNGAIARGDVVIDNQPTPDQALMDGAESMYKNEMKVAVAAMQREENVTREKAEELVRQRIDARGIDVVLPRFTAFMVRNKLDIKPIT
jgi:hypothetical protein